MSDPTESAEQARLRHSFNELFGDLPVERGESVMPVPSEEALAALREADERADRERYEQHLQYDEDQG